MIARWSVASLAMLVVCGLTLPVLAQESSVPPPLPQPDAFGDDWAVLPESVRATTGDNIVRHASYVGPAGARIVTVAYLFAPGPAAARDSWEAMNEVFDQAKFTFDVDYGRERDLEDIPALPGCADMRRLDGADELIPILPVGITLCAADPDLIVFALVSGEVKGLSGYRASDHVVELVVSSKGPHAATPIVSVPVRASGATATSVSGRPAVAHVATAITREPDRYVSAEDLALPDLLPTQEQVPAGLILTDEAERSKSEVIESLGGTDEAAQLLDDWGWSGNAFRDFVAPEGGELPASGTNLISASVHRFADAEAAANALVFFSDQVIFGQGLQEVEPPVIGDSARLLLGAPVAVLYVQDGPFMVRIGASTSSAEIDPVADILAVAEGSIGRIELVEATPLAAFSPTALPIASPTIFATQVHGTSFQPQHQVVATRPVNLRAGPSWRNPVLIELAPSTPLMYLGEDLSATASPDERRWMHFRTEEGRDGWLREIDTEPVDTSDELPAA